MTQLKYTVTPHIYATHSAGGAPNYYPNSFSGPVDDKKYLEHSIQLSGDVGRYNTADDDNFTQVGTFWNKVGSISGFYPLAYHKIRWLNKLHFLKFLETPVLLVLWSFNASNYGFNQTEDQTSNYTGRMCC